MPKNSLRILTYHRVLEPNGAFDGDPGLISATPEIFARQMHYLAKHFNVVAMTDVLEAVETGARLPAKSVLLTFDDAYVDFAAGVWPVLEKLRLPVTLFVPTGYPDHPEREFWWDRLARAFANAKNASLQISPLGELPLENSESRRASLKRLQNHMKSLPHAAAMKLADESCERLECPTSKSRSVLSWDALRMLAKGGVTLGAHTVTHPIMNRLSPKQIQREIRGSINDLEREIGETPPIFCYPAGGLDQTVVKILRKENIKTAFTTEDGLNDLNTVDPLRLRRTNITRKTTAALFRFRMQPWFTRIDTWRHRGKNSALAQA